MKKLLIASAVALFGLSNAQIAKGTVYLSGSVGYSQEETNNGNSKSENFNVLPTAGFFVAPNFAVGLGVGFQTQKDTSITTTINPLSTTVNTFETKNPAFVVAPFARKYWTLSDKLYFFGQLAVPMQFGKTEVENSSVTTTGTTTSTSSVSSEAKYTSVGVTVKPGLDYFLNKNWTIEATIGEFGYNNFKPKDGDATNNYSFGLNLANVGIGVKYVFAK
ncbi:MAG: porin family protein [Chryseobacterium sp.]|jgi:opacity protein-like surface antigen|uniref:outer membrane beta-barrel protein n=1 Tax=Chryseobacterium sp. TaxID=1871047 RepID=UPI002636CFA6|nr:outer membrane beta-barrel protein [Chryseobacterium sp.]MDF2552484.1 porin family protein [Chryseobacterium sp.]MDF2930745.1 porin family protein [Chryseobacterium sp.]